MASDLPLPENTDDLMFQLMFYTEEELGEVIDSLPDTVIEALLNDTAPQENSLSNVPVSPIAQACEVDPHYRVRAHLQYLSDRLAKAVEDVENGQSRYLVISMPPRSGKSQMTSVYFPLWLLRKHPDWSLGMISHTDTLAVAWGREIRRIIEERRQDYGLVIAKDAGAASQWQTTHDGGIVARSAPGQSITGLGFKVLLVDDAVKDFATAHSATARENLWNWWAVNAYTRLEHPALTVFVGTRWHEDDLLGRLLSPEYPGDPEQWEVISFPAIAEENDVLGRSVGEPLISPLVDETPEQALVRWAGTKATIGTYGWNALYQQRPSPEAGSIFDVGWWKYWTTDPKKVSDDGRVVLLPADKLAQGQWLDSWDCTFKGADSDSDYVVGQRWTRIGANRYLIAQQRDRWGFTQTIAKMKIWATDTPILSPYGRFVHQRLIEDSANGPAIIDTLKGEIAGIKPITAKNSKEARARAVTPEIESGNVYLPHPSEPGNQWVTDFVDEFRQFPNGTHDDQVDALAQALAGLRQAVAGKVTVPGRVASPAKRNLAAAARTDIHRRR